MALGEEQVLGIGRQVERLLGEPVVGFVHARRTSARRGTGRTTSLHPRTPRRYARRRYGRAGDRSRTADACAHRSTARAGRSWCWATARAARGVRRRLVAHRGGARGAPAAARCSTTSSTASAAGAVPTRRTVLEATTRGGGGVRAARCSARAGWCTAAGRWAGASPRRRSRKGAARATGSCSWPTRCTRRASPTRCATGTCRDVPAPMLFVQGTRDEFARWDLLTAVLERLGDRAPRCTRSRPRDHSFKVLKRSGAHRRRGRVGGASAPCCPGWQRAVSDPVGPRAIIPDPRVAPRRTVEWESGNWWPAAARRRAGPLPGRGGVRPAPRRHHPRERRAGRRHLLQGRAVDQPGDRGVRRARGLRGVEGQDARPGHGARRAAWWARSASWTAVRARATCARRTACELRRITRDGFVALMDDSPVLLAKMMVALSELLATRYRAVTEELEPVRALAASLREVADGRSGRPASPRRRVRPCRPSGPRPAARTATRSFEPRLPPQGRDTDRAAAGGARPSRRAPCLLPARRSCRSALVMEGRPAHAARSGQRPAS